MKHTPGPWFVYEPEFETHHGGEAITIIIGHERDPDDVVQEVCFVHCDSSYFDGRRVDVPSGLVTTAKAHPEALANARLIAAAPELLEACKFISVALRGDNEDLKTEAYHLVNAAISKATNTK